MTKIILTLLSFLCISVHAQGSKCSAEDCINWTFQSTHLNKWKLTNIIDDNIMEDTFILLEGMVGDTTFSNFNGYVSALLTQSYTIITEFEEKEVYILPHRSEGKVMKVDFSLPDSLQAYMKGGEDHQLAFVAENIYTTDYLDGMIKFKINPELCVIDWFEIIIDDVVESETSEGFHQEKSVKRIIRYDLLSHEDDEIKINQQIARNVAVSNKNNSFVLNQKYADYTITNLNSEIE